VISPQLLEPLYDAVTFIMVAFHKLFKFLGFDPGGGWAWGLSIVGLVVVIRILLIPLFVKQIKAQRGLQILQPEIKKIQAKYKGRSDAETRQKQQQEMMKLYKDNGTNPFASCLPIILQAPIFFALFQVLNGIGKQPAKAKGFLTERLAEQAHDAQILGAHISDKFIGAQSVTVQVVTAVLIVLMSATTFTTQKQLMSKNMPADAMNNPFAQQQKILLYVFPLVFAVSGVNFPIGVLLYWLTTNVWSMGQQFYVIRRMPAPGSPAEQALMERRRRKGKIPAAEDVVAGEVTSEPEPEQPTTPVSGQRQQPRRQNRSKRTTRPAGGATPKPGGKPASKPSGKSANPGSSTPPGR
jgi:YidC/Oxa1 family membrane protein insertase